MDFHPQLEQQILSEFKPVVSDLRLVLQTRALQMAQNLPAEQALGAIIMLNFVLDIFDQDLLGKAQAEARRKRAEWELRHGKNLPKIIGD